jgi:alpha-1,4-digalacturonate transport system permease protein
VGPNLAVFGLFTFLPIAVDFWYSLTGSTELLPKNRPYVGLDNFTTLLVCGEYLDPNSCVRDTFWYGVWNTAKFVLLQVGLVISLSLLTIVVLNRKIIGRGVFRAVFFYPVLLSPVVVALIWKWILQRDGVLNAHSGRPACPAPTGCWTRTGRSSGRFSSRSGPIWVSTR